MQSGLNPVRTLAHITGWLAGLAAVAEEGWLRDQLRAVARSVLAVELVLKEGQPLGSGVESVGGLKKLG